MILRIFFGFFRGLGTLAPAWWPWIGLLILVNAIVPLLFLGTVEAKVVLGAFGVAGLVQMALFRRFGFVRLLGIGHLVVWIPLLAWLWPRLPPPGAAGAFGKWLVALIAIDGLALVIDAVDVVRYALGDRNPTLTLEELG